MKLFKCLALFGALLVIAGCSAAGNGENSGDRDRMTTYAQNMTEIGNSDTLTNKTTKELALDAVFSKFIYTSITIANGEIDNPEGSTKSSVVFNKKKTEEEKSFASLAILTIGTDYNTTFTDSQGISISAADLAQTTS